MVCYGIWQSDTIPIPLQMVWDYMQYELSLFRQCASRIGYALRGGGKYQAKKKKIKLIYKRL